MIIIIILSSILVICSALMLLIILMQRPKQEGLGASFGGGMTQDLFGAQTTNVLQKATTYLAVIFFVISMLLAVLFNREAEAAKSAAGLGLDDATPVIEEPAAPMIEEGTAPVIEEDVTPAVEEEVTPPNDVAVPDEEADSSEEVAPAKDAVEEPTADSSESALTGAVLGELEAGGETEEASAGQ